MADVAEQLEQQVIWTVLAPEEQGVFLAEQ
jgi:hypothetical protein